MFFGLGFGVGDLFRIPSLGIRGLASALVEADWEVLISQSIYVDPSCARNLKPSSRNCVTISIDQLNMSFGVQTGPLDLTLLGGC